MSFEVVPLRAVPAVDLPDIAASLRAHLAMRPNSDIATEFPGSFERYSDVPEKVAANLEQTRANCCPGACEHFVALADGLAVGIAAVQKVAELDDEVQAAGVAPDWPNLGGFICYPWRHLGLGTLVWRAGVTAVQKEFDGHAWTLIRPSNTPSIRSITKVGFEKVGETTPQNENFGHRYIFTYGAAKHPV